MTPDFPLEPGQKAYVSYGCDDPTIAGKVVTVNKVPNEDDLVDVKSECADGAGATLHIEELLLGYLRHSAILDVDDRWRKSRSGRIVLRTTTDCPRNVRDRCQDVLNHTIAECQADLERAWFLAGVGPT